MKGLKNNFYMIKLLFKAAPLRVLLDCLASIVGYAGELVYSVFLLRFIMKAIESGTDFRKVILLLLGLLIYTVVTNIFFSWLDQWYTPKTDVIIQEHLMKKMYEKAIECDLSCYENPDFYNKYTRVNSEILQRGKNVLENFSEILGILVTVVACICIIAVWEPIVIPIVIVCGLVSVLIDKKRSMMKYDCMVKTTPHFRQCDYVKRTVYLQDYAKEMRLGNIFSPLIGQFNKAVKEALKITHHYYGMEAWLRVARELFMSLGTFFVVQAIIVYRYLEHRAYNLSDVVTVINAASKLQGRIYAFTWRLSDFIENGLFIENMRIFFDYKTKIEENENGIKPKDIKHKLSLKNVSFSYDGQKNEVLKNINIEIPPGQKVAFVGHNGAGKSTLVKLLMRLYDVSAGEILLDDVNIKEYVLSDYRHRFGTVFQDFKIFATDIAENILLHPINGEEDIKIVNDAINASGLSDKVNSLEHGINTQLTREFDDEGTILSGGEFQKIAVARVFAKQSSIAILDEPSSALDPISEYEMFENMMTACKDKTVIFISHRLSSAVSADVIYMLENGEIVEQGNHKDLMQKGGKYAQMFEMQSKQYREGASV